MDGKEKEEEVVVQNPEQGTVEAAAVEEKPEKPATPKRDAFMALMKTRLGDSYSDDDEEGNYDRFTGMLNKDMEDSKELASMIAKNPKFAQVLSDVRSGKRGAGAAMARYFGKDLLTAEEGTSEYDEIMKAEEERMQEVSDMADREKQYKDNLERTLPNLEEYCSEKGIDPAEFKNNIWEKFIYPVLNGEYSKELCAMFDKGMSYDKDIEDATYAGEVKGRNMNIEKMRGEKGDGMPKGISSQGDGEEVPAPKKKKNRLISMAMNA